MKLYGYFRSSAAFRVRIALNLKGLDYESAFIHLRRGDQREAGFLAVNPQGLVPALETDGHTLIQSLAINTVLFMASFAIFLALLRSAKRHGSLLGGGE